MHCHCSPKQQGDLWNGYKISANKWFSFVHQNQLIQITLEFFWGILPMEPKLETFSFFHSFSNSHQNLVGDQLFYAGERSWLYFWTQKAALHYLQISRRGWFLVEKANRSSATKNFSSQIGDGVWKRHVSSHRIHSSCPQLRHHDV